MIGSQRIRIRLCGYDHQVLDAAVQEIVTAVRRTGGKVAGPIPLPTRVERFTVNRSPHVDKKARDQFEVRSHKRLIDILEPTQQTIDDLGKLELSAGIDVEIKLQQVNMLALYGKKLGMTRVFTEAGQSVPVTVVEVTPNVVYQVRNNDVDGYRAVQVGCGTQKPQRLNRAETGHLAKAKKGFPSFVGEIRLDVEGQVDEGEYELGQEIKVEEVFEAGQKVDVSGLTTGKGYAGVMKRHGMKGQIRTHGVHEMFRHGGSIGNRKFPGRVFKNKRMAGHMGNVNITQEGLEVVAVRPEDNALLIKGSVPGRKNGIVKIRRSLKH